MQRVFAHSSFELTQSRRFRVVFGRENDHLCWFSRVLFLLCVKSDGVAGSEVELAFLQYFEVAPSEDENTRDLHFRSLRWAAHDEIDHSINSNPSHSCMNAAGEWYGVVSIFSIISVHLTARANYSLTPL